MTGVSAEDRGVSNVQSAGYLGYWVVAFEPVTSKLGGKLLKDPADTWIS
jgi:hypothetical protein